MAQATFEASCRARARPSRASARLASANSVAKSGTLLSHSISVATGPRARQRVVVEREDVVEHRACMRVDQQPVAGAVDRLVIAGEMDLADQFDREAVDIGEPGRAGG